MVLRLVAIALSLAVPTSSFSPAILRAPASQPLANRWGPASVVMRALLDAKGNPINLDGDSGEQPMQDQYEEALGQLVFSSADPTLDIARRIDFFDEAFVAWVDAKAEASDDLEERGALKSLGEMVIEVREKYFQTIASAEAGEFDGTAEAGEESEDPFAGVPFASFDESGNAVLNAKEAGDEDASVLGAMKAVQFAAAGGEGASAEDAKRLAEAADKAKAEAALAARTTYIQLLATLIPMPQSEMEAAVTENFLRCDFTFMGICEEVCASDPDVAPKVKAVMDQVNKEASLRIEKAAGVVQQVLAAGNPGLMETEITKLCKQGKVDFAVLDLLDANIQAATAAGALEPAAVMSKVRTRAALELDKLKDPEQRLMSQLLRTSDAETRTSLLQAAFEPKEQLTLALTDMDPEADDKKADPAPEVSPDKFIEMSKAMIQNFGNLPGEEGGLRDKLLSIAQEAEQVSTSIYGESMTAREQQDRAWADTTVSVWDLETMEQESEINGETQPWSGEMDEQVFIDKMKGPAKGGFDDKGVKTIGGY
mmetsp:Transcript_75118/g.142408  ORF Transcript_75118/g.142408 Transcript_75118/m.142408 type:complete len:540 (+) Transcript_75118:20-1639(+)